MAQMYPAKFPHYSNRNTGKAGEHIVYQALQQMPDDWVVIYNCWRHLLSQRSETAKSEHISYEADFIVLIPRRGIMVLEVKNWFRAKVENGIWYRGCGPAAEDFTPVNHGSPLNQAYMAANYLRHELMRHFSMYQKRSSKLEVRCMAVILGTLVDTGQGMEVYEDIRAVDSLARTATYRNTPRNEIYDQLYLCGTGELENHLQSRIEQLFCFNNQTPPEELDEVRRYLLQNLVLQLGCGEVNRIIDYAAAPLRSILPMLRESAAGIHVQGCAGSGKSTMLCAEAAALSRSTLPNGQSPRVQIMCYNLNLAEHLRNMPELQQAHVSSYNTQAPLVLDNFHTIAKHICQQEGIALNEKGNFLTEPVIQELCLCIPQNPQYQADYILVDEAQDFAPEWWPVVQSMLRPSSGKLYLFSDRGQCLYHHGDTLPNLPTRLRLSANIRNTAPIAQFAAALIGAPAEQLPLPGPEVQVFTPADDFESRARNVQQAIGMLLEDNFAAQDIVVLTPWRRHNSLKSPLLQHFIDFPADDSARENANERLLRCTGYGANLILGETIKAFKGMESYAIILTDICAPKNAPGSGFTAHDLYVACTRARYRLIIIPNTDGANYLNSLPGVHFATVSPDTADDAMT